MNKKAALIKSLNDRFSDNAQIWVRVLDAGEDGLLIQYDTGCSDGLHDFKFDFNSNYRELLLFEFIRFNIMLRIMPSLEALK
jgi:hypothetical protein